MSACGSKDKPRSRLYPRFAFLLTFAERQPCLLMYITVYHYMLSMGLQDTTPGAHPPVKTQLWSTFLLFIEYVENLQACLCPYDF